MWIKNSFFKYTIGTILVLATFLLLHHSLPIFQLMIQFLATISLPLLFSVFLYYLLCPLVMILEPWLPKWIAILLIYLVMGVALTAFGLILIPELGGAMASISPNNLDSIKDHLFKFLGDLSDNIPFFNAASIEKMLEVYIPKINSFIYQLVIELITAITGFSVALALTPFILYYFLRDDHLFSNYVLRFTPDKHQEEVKKIMSDIDITLTGFISTQAAIAIIIGCFLSIGYLIIGLPFALLLALFAMIFYVIPFLGTFLAIIPALVIAASVNFSMIIKVIIIMLIAHIIEAYLITPKMMSNSLKIHPLTVIILLLVGGSLFGILGLILITPAYCIIKVFVWNIYKIARLRYTIAKLQDAKDEANENLRRDTNLT